MLFSQGSDTGMFNKLSNPSTFKVNKPLILLKITLFSWFGAGASLYPFLILFLQQTGLSVVKISLIYTILPFTLFLGPVVSGVIADKLGRSKPVLQGNLLLVLLSAGAILLLPMLKSSNCYKEKIRCYTETFNNTGKESFCHFYSNGSGELNCKFQCPFDMQGFCFENYILSCGNSSNGNVSWFEYEEYAPCIKEPRSEVLQKNDSWCLKHTVKDCNFTCMADLNDHGNGALCNGNTLLFVVASVVVIIFRTLLSNCYRIMEVTAMSMVKSHNSDYGIQRFWAILGILVFAPFSGYLVSVLSPKTGTQNYYTAFYLFEAMSLFTMFLVWKLDVKLEPPAKNMFKNASLLLRNADTVGFLLVIFVIGTTWGFRAVFSNLYLKGLNAPSSLLGLVPAVNGLIGLPFLLSSKWFMTKIGSTNLLVLALLGYVVICIGYSFLGNPWWCLAYEAFGTLSYHLLWVTVATHSHKVAPKGLMATTISFAGSIHFSIGIGSGSLIGGTVLNKYGGRIAFRVMAAMCFGTSVLYVFYLFCRRKFFRKPQDPSKTENGEITDCELDDKSTPQV